MASSIVNYVAGLYESILGGGRRKEEEEFKRRYEDWVRHHREVLGGY